MTHLDKLHDVMAQLEVKGWVAPQKSYACCTSCGFGKLTDVKNAVFYHDESRSKAICKRCNDLKDDLHLNWKGKSKYILKALEENGIDYEWDHDKHSCIIISPPPRTLRCCHKKH